MSLIFAKVVNMSISAGILILAVILVRLLFRKLPRKIFIIVWILVMIRLVCPLTIFNSLSPVPDDFFSGHTSNTKITGDTEWQGKWSEQSEVPAGKDDPGADAAAPAFDTFRLLSIVWAAGAAAILAGAAIKAAKLRRTVKDAVNYRDNVYLSSGIKTSFVLGVFDPKIYVPSIVGTEQRRYMIDHESEHIRHRDHLLKLLFYVILSVHWFDPLVHIAYHLFSEDLEMACDERTIEKQDAEYRANYLQTLLDCGISSSIMSFGTLSFGNVGIKRRIERIMNYKKTKTITIIVFAVVFVALVFFLMTNNATAAENAEAPEDYDDYVHMVIRDADGKIVEETYIYQPEATRPSEPLTDLPEYGSVSAEDVQQYDKLIRIRDEVLREGVSRSSGELGDPVFAVCEGEVISSDRDGAYGLCVTIKDNDGRTWKYGHCCELIAKAGDHVSFGDPIAYIGSTGLIESPGLIIRIVEQ